jgi:hypothetical protein
MGGVMERSTHFIHAAYRLFRMVADGHGGDHATRARMLAEARCFQRVRYAIERGK